MSALSAASFIAPVARRVASKSTRKNSPRAFRCQAIYTESARVPAPGEDERRWRETERVMERTKIIHDTQELSAAFHLAGDKLVMVAIESDEECTMSDDWTDSSGRGSEGNLEACKQLSSSLSRIAREADDVAFLKVEVIGDNAARHLAHDLGVTQYPTYQYYKVRLNTARTLASPAPRGHHHASFCHSFPSQFFCLSVTPSVNHVNKREKIKNIFRDSLRACSALSECFLFHGLLDRQNWFRKGPETYQGKTKKILELTKLIPIFLLTAFSP